MANLATKAGVEGTQRLKIHTPADRAHQGADHRARPRPGRRLRLTLSCYDPVARRATPAATATRACSASRASPRVGLADPAPYRRRRPCGMTYAVKEIFYTLQGRAPTPAGRRCSAASPAATCGPGARQDRATADLPVLRHRLRRHRRPRRRQVSRPPRTGRRGRAALAGMDGRSRAALRRVHRRRTAAPARRAARGRPPPRGFEVAVETNGTQPAAAGLDWICVSPKAGAELVLAGGRRAEAGVSRRTRRRPGAASTDLDFRHFFLQPMDGPTARAEHAARRRVLPRPSAVAAEPADPQVLGILTGCSMEIFKEFTFEAAHRLPNVPAGTSAAGCTATPSARGARPRRRRTRSRMVMDFADLKAAFRPLHDQLDHNYLNEVDGLENPTSENLARWIWERLDRRSCRAVGRSWSAKPARRVRLPRGESEIEDVQGRPDGRGIAHRRGRGQRHPLTRSRCSTAHTRSSRRSRGRRCPSACRTTFKGTHMSRFIEVLDEHRGEVTMRTLASYLAGAARASRGGDRARGGHVPLLPRGRAPVSGARR